MDMIRVQALFLLSATLTSAVETKRAATVLSFSYVSHKMVLSLSLSVASFACLCRV